MPEMPEVQTVVSGLKPHITGKSISKIMYSGHKLRAPYPGNYTDLYGKTIKNVTRRSKYILISIANQVLVFHLGMTGKLMYQNMQHTPSAKHDHVTIHLQNSEMGLVFNDARRFGLVAIVEASKLAEHPLFNKLGPEPLTDDFNDKYMLEYLKSRKRNIKSILMDAHFVVGVGNIYASEALYRAKISPLKPGCNLVQSEIVALQQAVVDVLKDAVNSGGSTLRDYVQSNGDVGGFQHYFNVYGKDGQPCDACRTSIVKCVIGGRSTFYCPACQG